MTTVALNRLHYKSTTNSNHYIQSLLYISTFLAPWFAIFPTSAGLYELLLFFLFLYIIVCRKHVVMPDKYVSASLFLILTGYSLSIINSQQPLEAVKLPLQFSFIILVQSVVLYTLTRTRRHLYYHAISLVISLFMIILYFFTTTPLYNNFINTRLVLFYNNPNTFALHIAPAVILAAYISYSKWKEDRPHQLVLFCAITIIGLAFIALSQSRRVFIYLFVCFFLIVGTSFGRRNQRIELLTKGMVSVIGLGIVGFIIYILGLFPDIFIERLNPFEGRGSLENRHIPLVLAFRFLRENLIFGSGYNNFDLFLNELAETPIEERYAHKPHNMFIIPFVEGGIFSGIGVVALAGIICRRILIGWKVGWFEHSEVAFVFAICTLGFFSAQLFGVFSILRLNWLIIFLGLISINIVRENTKDSV